MNILSKIIRKLFIILFFCTPLIFTTFNSELFELPKMYFVYLLTLIIFTFHLFNSLNKKSVFFKKTFLDIPLLIFFVSQTISTIFSTDPHTSFFGYYSRLNGGLLSTICYLVLYWILAIYINDQLKKNIILSSLLSGFLIASFGIAEHFGIDKHIWVQDVQSRVFSTLGQPNWLAAYLCILLPFSIFQSLQSFSQKKYLLSTIYNLQSIILFTCLLFTKSKSGIIAAIISLSIFFIIYFFQNLNPLLNKKPPFLREDVHQDRWVLITILILFTILSLTINNPIKEKIFPQKLSVINNPQSNNLLITPSEDIRKIVWKGALDLWKKFPVFGTGVETFAYSYYWTRPVEHNLTSEWDFLYNKAHNEYLNYLATTGAFGFLSYLSIIIIFLFFIVRKLFKKFNLLSLTLLTSFISILITNFAGFSVVTISIYFFLLPALLIENQNIQKKEPKLSSSKFISLIILLLSFLIFQKIIFYYLADISYSQSESLDNKNEYQMAYDQIKTSLDYRNNEPIYLGKASYLATKLAIIYNSQKDKETSKKFIDEAINYSDKAIKISPSSTNTWKERSQTFYLLSTIDIKYFENAIKSLIAATTLAPTDAKNFYMIGKFLQSANYSEEAIPYFEKAVSLKPNYDYAFFELGKIYFDKKDFKKAKINFEKVLEIAPSNQKAKDYLKKLKL